MSQGLTVPFGPYAGGGSIGHALALACTGGMESTPEAWFVADSCKGGMGSPRCRRWMPSGNEWQKGADLLCRSGADQR